jgi:hypothetical protein
MKLHYTIRMTVCSLVALSINARQSARRFVGLAPELVMQWQGKADAYLQSAKHVAKMAKIGELYE